MTQQSLQPVPPGAAAAQGVPDRRASCRCQSGLPPPGAAPRRGALGTLQPARLRRHHQIETRGVPSSAKIFCYSKIVIRTYPCNCHPCNCQSVIAVGIGRQTDASFPFMSRKYHMSSISDRGCEIVPVCGKAWRCALLAELPQSRATHPPQQTSHWQRTAALPYPRFVAAAVLQAAAACISTNTSSQIMRPKPSVDERRSLFILFRKHTIVMGQAVESFLKLRRDEA